MQKLLLTKEAWIGAQRRMAQKRCKLCAEALCIQETGPGIALICLQEGCPNNWTRDGAEIILMLR